MSSKTWQSLGRPSYLKTQKPLLNFPDKLPKSLINSCILRMHQALYSLQKTVLYVSINDIKFFPNCKRLSEFIDRAVIFLNGSYPNSSQNQRSSLGCLYARYVLWPVSYLPGPREEFLNKHFGGLQGYVQTLCKMMKLKWPQEHKPPIIIKSKINKLGSRRWLFILG